MDEALTTRIAEFIARSAGASTSTEVLSLQQMPSGESKQNWLLELDLSGGEMAGKQRFILRLEEEEIMPFTHNCVHEYSLLKALYSQDVKVPRPIFVCDLEDVSPTPFFVMERVPGRASGERLIADVGGSEEGDLLTRQISEELAKVHKIRPPQEELIFLETPPPSPAQRTIDVCYAYLDRLMETITFAAYPVLEWGLRWLSLNKPEKEDVVLCHGDFRLHNLMVSEKELSGIIDWEYAYWSDPHEDLAMFCAKFSRAGAPELVAGGLSNREVLLDSYARASKREVDEMRLLFWEILCNIHRALILIEHGRRHIKGLNVSLDLALKTHNVAELELEILSLIDRAERIATSDSKKKQEQEKLTQKIAAKALDKENEKAQEKAAKKERKEAAKEEKAREKDKDAKDTAGKDIKRA